MRIVKITRNGMEQKERSGDIRPDAGPAVRRSMHRVYVLDGVPHANNGELKGVGSSTVSRNSPLESDLQKSNPPFHPFNFPEETSAAL
jgi:hypothetical protein